jgi:restriction system protein
MAKRSGFEKVIRAIARETAKQQLDEAERRVALRTADRAERQESRARAIRQREQVRYGRESEQAARQHCLEFREQDVRDGNATIRSWIEGLRAILSSTLMVDDTVIFDSLRLTDNPPPFAPAKSLTTVIERPSLQFFTSKITPLRWYFSLFSRFKAKHAYQLQAAREQFQSPEEEDKAQGTQRLEMLRGARESQSNSSRVRGFFSSSKKLELTRGFRCPWSSRYGNSNVNRVGLWKN